MFASHFRFFIELQAIGELRKTAEVSLEHTHCSDEGTIYDCLDFTDRRRKRMVYHVLH